VRLFGYLIRNLFSFVTNVSRGTVNATPQLVSKMNYHLHTQKSIRG